MKMQVNTSSNVTNWYVVYTYPKAERKVTKQLDQIGIESFLPLHEQVRKWHDRRKILYIPMFPNYVFVKIKPQERSRIFEVKEIVRFISFGGTPTKINEVTINSLKNITSLTCLFTVENYLYVGSPVIITSGPFRGIEGVVLRRNGRLRIIIQVVVLQKSLIINVDETEVSMSLSRENLVASTKAV